MRHLVITTFLFAVACGDSTTSTPNGPTGPAPLAVEQPRLPPAAADTAPTGLAIAFGAPRLAAISAHGSRALVVEAVYGATALSGAQQLGQITRTGTLRIGAAGATYEPQPTDRLVVDLAGKRHEITLQDAQGNAQAADAATWLLSPHRLSYRHVIPDEAEADFDVRFDGNTFTVRMTGRAAFAGQRTELDLTATGQTGGVRDFDGHDLKTSYRMTGTLRGEGFEVDVVEEHALTSVGAQSLRTLPGMRGSASRVETVIGSTLRSGGKVFRFESVRALSDTKEKGGVMRNQESTVSGTVSCDGATYGQCVMVGSAPFVQVANATVPLAMR